MSELAPQDPEVIPVPRNVGALPALVLPRRYESHNIPVYLCNPYSEPITSILIDSYGTDLQMGLSVKGKIRRFSAVAPLSCLVVANLDLYVDGDMLVGFYVRWWHSGNRFYSEADILHWPSKMGMHFRLHARDEPAGRFVL